MIDSFINASLGGLLIGLSALIMFALKGRIAGISGILWQSLMCLKFKSEKSGFWPFLFVGGLVFGAVIVHYVFGFPIPNFQSSNIILVIVSGFLVGMGTRIGSGCTSGHGICGIGRLSIRSIVATMTFMAVAIAVVFISRHLMG